MTRDLQIFCVLEPHLHIVSERLEGCYLACLSLCIFHYVFLISLLRVNSLGCHEVCHNGLKFFHFLLSLVCAHLKCVLGFACCHIDNQSQILAVPQESCCLLYERGNYLIQGMRTLYGRQGSFSQGLKPESLWVENQLSSPKDCVWDIAS